MRLPTLFLAAICLCGCASSQPKNAPPGKKPLVHFEDSNFGVRFSHPVAISTIYNPHGGADQIMMSCEGKPVGGLIIGPLPPAQQMEDFVANGKTYYKTKYDAASVDYSLYENPHRYKFHFFKAAMARDGENYIIERFVHLRDAKPKKPDDYISLDAMFGAFSFEFLYPAADYERLKPDFRTVIDTFRLVDRP